jgi:hypothetical protein
MYPRPRAAGARWRAPARCGQRARLGHRLGVGGKSRPVARETFSRNPEQGGEQAVFGVIALALLLRERGQHQRIRHDRCLRERRVHPAQRRRFVRAVERARGKWSRRRPQRARDGSVAMMQAARGLAALTERTEDHREGGAEGAPMGLANVSECCSIAAAIQGWASCSNSARPAPKKIAASLSTCQVIDRGPNTPASEPAAAPRTRLSSRSRFSVPTMSSGSCSIRAFILVALIPNSAELCGRS